MLCSGELSPEKSLKDQRACCVELPTSASKLSPTFAHVTKPPPSAPHYAAAALFSEAPVLL